MSAEESQGGQKVVRKKVKPYPFAAQLEAGAAKKAVEVMHLTTQGMLVRLAKDMIFVGEHYQSVFEIPTIGFVNAPVRVIKIYDRSVNPKEHKVERMAELHFEALEAEHKSRITSFIKAIGQR